jgi:hypothetical protein
MMPTKKTTAGWSRAERDKTPNEMMTADYKLGVVKMEAAQAARWSPEARARAKEREEQRKAASQVITVEEAGALIGLGRNASYGAAKRGEIPTIKIGRKLAVPKLWVGRLIERALAAPQQVEEDDQ